MNDIVFFGLLGIFLIIFLFIIFLRWAFRIDTIVRRLDSLNKNIEEANTTNNDIRILLTSIDDKLTKNNERAET